MIKFRCYTCTQKIGVKERYIGKRVRCPVCRTHHTIPSNQVRWVEKKSEKHPRIDRTILLDTVAGLEATGEAGDQAAESKPVQITTDQEWRPNAMVWVALLTIGALASIGIITGILFLTR